MPQSTSVEELIPRLKKTFKGSFLFIYLFCWVHTNTKCLITFFNLCGTDVIFSHKNVTFLQTLKHFHSNTKEENCV